MNAFLTQLEELLNNATPRPWVDNNAHPEERLKYVLVNHADALVELLKEIDAVDDRIRDILDVLVGFHSRKLTDEEKVAYAIESFTNLLPLCERSLEKLDKGLTLEREVK